MDKIGYPRGLVRYSTQAAIDGDATHVLRPRTAIYAGLLVALIYGFSYAVTHRAHVSLDVLRDRNALLESGGFARQYGERDLSAPELADARRAIDLLIADDEWKRRAAAVTSAPAMPSRG